MPTCTAITSCAPRSHCDDSSLPAACLCDLGYAGLDCSACSPGFVVDSNGACAPELHHTILAAGSLGSTSILVGIDPVSGVVQPLRTLGTTALVAPVDGLAVDSANRSIYASLSISEGHEALAKLDVATSELALVPWSAGATTLESAIAFDSQKGRIVAFGSTAQHPLLSIDPSMGTSTTGPATDLVVPVGAAVEPSTGDLLAVTRDGSIARIDAATGAWSPVSLEGTAHRQYVGIATDPMTGHVFLARQADDGLGQVARRVALGLGFPSAATAEPTVVTSGAEGVTRLTSSLAAGPELFVVAPAPTSDGLRSTITIDVQNPDAGIVLWDRTPTDIVVRKAARFAFLVVYSDSDSSADRGDALAIEPFAPRPFNPTIHFAPVAADRRALDASCTHDVSWSRSYSAGAWADRRLPPAPDALTYE